MADVNGMKTRLMARTDNRGAAYDSPNQRDWVEVDFGEEQQVRRLDLYLWGDEDGVGAPEACSVEYWTGSEWKETTVEKRTPERPTAMAKNTVLIEPVRTSKVRVVFEHALPKYAGLAELRVWADNSLL